MSPAKPPSSPSISGALPRPMAPNPAKSSGSGSRNIARARRLTLRARRLRNGPGCGASTPGFAPGVASGEYFPP